jgi:hypothetical protein
MREANLRRGNVPVVAIIVVMAVAGCTTAPLPGPESATLETEGPAGLEVIERPELEPMWADFVKYYYPSWREHYWVDRGEWGNKGYVLGRAPETRRTGEMPRVQLSEQAPYGLDLRTAGSPPQPLGMTPLEDLSLASGTATGPPAAAAAPGEMPSLDLPPLGTMPVTQQPPSVVRPQPGMVRPPAGTPPRTRPTPPPRRQAQEYVVQKGDSLWSIASKVYGDPLGWVDIYRANQDVLPDPQKIFPKQRLTIPRR